MLEEAGAGLPIGMDGRVSYPDSASISFIIIIIIIIIFI
jgi:hypothetical protein